MHKLMYECLVRLAWKGFLPWVERHHTNSATTIHKTQALVKGLWDDSDNNSIEDILDDGT